MKALDTTILEKYLTRETNGNSNSLNPLFAKYPDSNHFFVNDVVIIEVANLLEENIKFDNSHIVAVIREFVYSDKIVLQERENIERALTYYTEKNRPFAECLKQVLNENNHCSETIRASEQKTGSMAYSKLAG